ncbi:hypothetical protein ACPV5L_07530 [Vibrio astriarenae]
MRDGDERWWDVSSEPSDLISFPEITNWSELSKAHRLERNKLLKVLPRFDTYQREHDFISAQ